MAIEREPVHDLLDEEIEGLDALDIPLREEVTTPKLESFWSAVWPKLSAVAIILALWQIVYWIGIWEPFALPSPSSVFKELASDVRTGDFWKAVATTGRRALLGFALAIVIGSVLGLAVSRSAFLRKAFGSIITGLQSMPSVVWVPFAILLFKLSEPMMLFVVILGAAPSIANGLIAGVDYIPPLLLRAGKVMGARGFAAVRHVVLPAALPVYVAGLKQGWAFGWRSLMAAEIIAQVAGSQSIGGNLFFAYNLSDAPRMIEMMVVVLVIGIAVDTVFFTKVETALRRRRGLIEVGATA